METLGFSIHSTMSSANSDSFTSLLLIQTSATGGIIGRTSGDTTDQPCPGLLWLWFAILARQEEESGREREREQGGVVSVISLMALESQLCQPLGSQAYLVFQAPVSLVFILLLNIL